MVKQKSDKETAKLREKLATLFKNNNTSKVAKQSHVKYPQNIHTLNSKSTVKHVPLTGMDYKLAESMQQNMKSNKNKNFEKHKTEFKPVKQQRNVKETTNSVKHDLKDCDKQSATISGHMTKGKQNKSKQKNDLKENNSNKKHEKNNLSNTTRSAQKPQDSKKQNNAPKRKGKGNQGTEAQGKKPKIESNSKQNGYASKKDPWDSDGASIDSDAYLEKALVEEYDDDVEDLSSNFVYDSDNEAIVHEKHKNKQMNGQKMGKKQKNQHKQNVGATAANSKKQLQNKDNDDSIENLLQDTDEESNDLNASLAGYVAGGDFDDDNSIENDSYEFDSEIEEETETEQEDSDIHSYLDSDYSEDYETESFGSYQEYDCDYNDKDYQLPEHVPEDLIIHKGTAVKYAIPTEDNVLLDSDAEDAQIVEPEQPTVKSVQQPVAYTIESLTNLNEMHTKVRIELKTHRNDSESNSSTSTECPELVPITESDLDSIAESFNSDEYELISEEESSILSIDINDKYSKTNSSTEEGDWEEEASDDDVQERLFKSTRCLLKADVFKDNKVSSQTPSILKQPQCGAEVEQITVDDILSSGEMCSNTNFVSVPVFEKDDVNSTVSSDSSDVAVMENSAATTPQTTFQESAIFEDKIKNRETYHQSRNIYCNAINSNDVLLVLKDPIFIYGTLRMTLLHGCVDVYGHAPNPGVCVDIFSPRGCSLVKISPEKGADTSSDTSNLESVLAPFSAYFTKKSLNQLRLNYVPGSDCLLLLQRNLRAKKLVSNFKKFMSENLFPNIHSLPHDRPHYGSEYLLQCIINNESTKGLHIPTDWHQLRLETNTKLLLAGGKGVGKSTLLRYLVNRHLSSHPRILVIDLDIGQPELFVPQTISCSLVRKPILGTGFHLMQQPDRAYFVGHVNIAYCAELYMRAVKQLLAYCNEQSEYANIPWLINTMGYNKGFGPELIACVADYVNPTDIVQLQSNKAINNFDMPLEANVLSSIPRLIYSANEFRTEKNTNSNWNLHLYGMAKTQETRYQKEWDMSPKDLRYAMILARLSAALQGNAEWLTDCQPLSAPLDKLHVVNVLEAGDTREELLAAMEANLVYLCKYEESQILECFGIGVVRGIDATINQIYLVPALPYENLKLVDCLALGELTLPNSIFSNQGPKVSNVAPFVYNAIQANASKAIKQIYHRPTQFLTGIHRKI